MKNKYLATLVLLLSTSFILFAQNDGNNDNSYLLFELGVVYPELEFVDSQDSALKNWNNISSNRLAIGGGGPLVRRLGYLATLSSNRYDLRTYYNKFGAQNDVHYFFDYLALDANLTFRFLKANAKWSPLLRAGASYNYLVSGFQEMQGMTIDLKDNEDYTNDHIDLNFGFSLRRKLGQHGHFWLGYLYKYGFKEKEIISEQRYKINAHTANLGFSISTDAFKKKDDDYKKILKKCNANIEDLREELLLLLEQDADTSADEWVAFVTPDENQNSPLREEIKAYVNTIFHAQGQLSDEPKTVVLFPTNDTQYYEIFEQDLIELTTYLKHNPAKKITVVGYADLRGQDDANLELSKGRSATVINYLINNGVDAKSIVHEYRGATSKFDDVVLMSNRRVEVFLNR